MCLSRILRQLSRCLNDIWRQNISDFQETIAHCLRQLPIARNPRYFQLYGVAHCFNVLFSTNVATRRAPKSRGAGSHSNGLYSRTNRLNLTAEPHEKILASSFHRFLDLYPLNDCFLFAATNFLGKHSDKWSSACHLGHWQWKWRKLV